MTTINTIEDLVRLLDENPLWAEALRARLLTRELLELPERHASFVAETQAQFALIAQQFAVVNEKFEQIDQRFEQIDQRFEQIDQRFDLVDGRLDRLETEMSRVHVDLGYLKGSHARNVAVEDADLIALDMGFRRVRNLTRNDLVTMSNTVDSSGLRAGELRSFRRADLVIEAEDANGVSTYIAVEISFTVNGRDTARAVRNAELLTTFTGRQALAAVAGVRKDDRIQEALDSGQVAWYELDSSDLEAE